MTNKKEKMKIRVVQDPSIEWLKLKMWGRKELGNEKEITFSKGDLEVILQILKNEFSNSKIKIYPFYEKWLKKMINKLKKYL